MTESDRYKKLGLMVGLELHQQLNTTRKLYCHCPPEVRDDLPDGKFIRRLRPTQSEMGAVDPAALFEYQKQKKFCYEYYNGSTCLVEADEEPPHELNEDAIDICLTMARFLDATPVDEIHPMRKIVIDGSNTTGFQRTAIVANGGQIDVDGKMIGIQTICLEEDAARKIADDESNNMRIYRLDRLGIPLIEVATAPDIQSPAEAQAVALAVGLLLRSTGRVKRGLGTIRQDVNISIRDGAIIEIKGLQQLEMLSSLVEFEALRQERLLEIRDELSIRGILPGNIQNKFIDVSAFFKQSESKVIIAALKSGGAVYAMLLPGFAGLIGLEIQPGRRLGTELSDYAKFWGGVGGIFHTDELPKYGITENDVAQLRKVMNAKEHDAVVLVAASEEKCKEALEAVLNRAKEAAKGVPAETRTPLPEGTSKYARPRPGSSRMYPETDVRPVKITNTRLRAIKKNMPETIEEREKRFVRDYGMSVDLAHQIAQSTNLDLFEQIIHDTKSPPTLIAVTLENTLVSLHRDQVPIDRLQDHHFIDLFKLVASKKVTSEAIPTILTHLANNPRRSLEEVLLDTDLTAASKSEIEDIVQRIIHDREEFIRAQGERSVGGLMGLVMKELGGKADGKIVRELLADAIKKLLNN